MASDHWRGSLLAREALINTTNWRAKSAVLAALAVLIGVMCPLFMAYEAVGLHSQLSALADQGRGVITFTQASSEAPAKIGRASCEHLIDVAGVQRAGLMEFPDPTLGQVADLNVPQLGGRTPLAHASASLFPELRTYDGLVGNAINNHAQATSLSLNGQIIQGAPLKAQPEGIGVNSVLVLPLPATTSAGLTCIAVLDPEARASELTPQLQVRLDVIDNPILASEQLRQSLDPISIFVERPTRFLPLLLTVLAALTAVVLNQIRSSEFAAYRMSGTSRRSLAIIVLLEQGLLTSIGFASSIATIFLIRDQLISPLSAAIWCLAGFTLWWLLATALSLPGLMRRPSRLAKDR